MACTCNQLAPFLRAAPSFGDGMRCAVEGKVTAAYAAYTADPLRTVRVSVEWGDWPPAVSAGTCVARLNVRGLGRRPAGRVVARASVRVRGDAGLPPPLSVAWATRGGDGPAAPFPEYVAELDILDEADAGGVGSDDASGTVVRRTLHVIPAPESADLDPPLDEVLFVPQPSAAWRAGGAAAAAPPAGSARDGGHATPTADAPDSDAAAGEADIAPAAGATLPLSAQDAPPAGVTRRGFGLELETVQLPPDTDRGHFTKQSEWNAAVERLRADRTAARASRDGPSRDGASPPHRRDDDNSLPADDACDRLLLWQVGHDPQVENATPRARVALHRRWLASLPSGQRRRLSTAVATSASGAGGNGNGSGGDIDSGGKDGNSDGDGGFDGSFDGDGGGEDGCDGCDDATADAVHGLLLGGDQALCDDFPSLGRVSLSSPEYKTPAPPNELFYEFPRDSARPCAAEREIGLAFDAVLKGTLGVPVLCPALSGIGQSGSSIHVHVNVCNPLAWPRRLQGGSPVRTPAEREAQAGGHATAAADAAASIDGDDQEPTTSPTTTTTTTTTATTTPTSVVFEADLAETRALLAVFASWVRFDGVTRAFGRPWVWRDRSLAPLFATWPEFVWSEVAWTQGSVALQPDQDPARVVKTYNVPAFFKHAFERLRAWTLAGAEASGSSGGSSSSAVVEDNPDVAAPTTQGAEVPVPAGSDDGAAGPGQPEQLARDGDDDVVLPALEDMFASDGNDDAGSDDDNGDGDGESNDGSDLSDDVGKRTAERPRTVFDDVFDARVIHRTLYRNCSLNLEALRKYGTVEFRRMHATLDARFVAAWTRFVVAFVERFGGDWARFGEPFFGSEVSTWQDGLERLAGAQRDATLDELVRVLADEVAGFVTREEFDTLVAGGGSSGADQSSKTAA